MTQVSSLYLHVPFCKHLCNYCDFYKRKLEAGSKQFEDFHSFLTASMHQHETILKQNGFSWAPLDTVYLGGGTPSLWGSVGATFFKTIVPEILPNAEFTMEVDPGTWNEDMLASWKELGLNRISMGTQSLNPEFLKIMDRVHSLDDSVLLLEKLQKENWNFSLDFLLGIPFSKDKKRNIQDELDLLLKYNPKHISLYILNARSKYPYSQDLPDDEYIRDEYLFVSEYLQKKGFHHYEVSNFALPGFEARHNQKYWRGESVAALGPTGTGYLSLSRDKAIRYKWKVTKAEAEFETLGISELELEETYLGLRCSDGWAPRSFSDAYERVFNRWLEQGFAKEIGSKVKLTSLGFLMLDSLMDDLFRV